MTPPTPVPPGLRVAVVGAGHMARQHLDAIPRAGNPHAVVGIVDLDRGRGGALAAHARAPWFPTLAELLRTVRPNVVHVCTPPHTHFEVARDALVAGAHVYVEKPFAQTTTEAKSLLALARERGLLVCAGHQLLAMPAFTELMRRASALRPIVQVDVQFSFRPVGLRPGSAGAGALADQLADILPHPLYLLVATLEGCATSGSPAELAWVQAGPTDVQAVVRADGVIGRLAVSLRARPIASTLTLTGAEGSLTANLMHGVVVGAGNPGTEPLEKILNSFVEGGQVLWRTAWSLARRFSRGDGYPGLAELIGAFHRAIALGGVSPVSPGHLRTVTALQEAVLGQVRSACHRPERSTAPVTAPLAVVTGARGFLGKEVARSLARRGFQVRGVGRIADRDDPHVHEWVVADLGRPLPPSAIVGAGVVVHAAAATAGGFAEHERSTIGATRHVLQAMKAAGVGRLVYVSSLSVLRPPRTPWERQDERTPRPTDPRPLGPYTWGKCLAEEVVERDAASCGVTARTVRPAALVDWSHPDLPWLVGRRLFGRWHLGLGRPGLPFAVCDVGRAGDAIAWCAARFEEAPAIVNLIDPAIATRRALLERFRAGGWTGRMVWMPIPLFVAALTAARTLLALLGGRLPTRLAAWAILRPRRYDTSFAGALLEAAGRETRRTGEPAAAPISA